MRAHTPRGGETRPEARDLAAAPAWCYLGAEWLPIDGAFLLR
jgi:hypothetical protein